MTAAVFTHLYFSLTLFFPLFWEWNEEKASSSVPTLTLTFSASNGHTARRGCRDPRPPTPYPQLRNSISVNKVEQNICLSSFVFCCCWVVLFWFFNALSLFQIKQKIKLKFWMELHWWLGPGERNVCTFHYYFFLLLTWCLHQLTLQPSSVTTWNFVKVKALSSLRGGAVGWGYSSLLAHLAHVIAQVLTLPETWKKNIPLFFIMILYSTFLLQSNSCSF